MSMKNVDRILQALADIEGTHLTLYVKGNIISGETIKSSEFARRIGNADGQAPAPFEVFAQKFEEAEAKKAELLGREGDVTGKDRKALRKMLRHFITLKDARFSAGSSGFQPREGMPEIRIRLDAVDAWSWGSMSSTIGTT